MDASIIFKYFPDLDEEQKSQILKLQEVYNFYNAQVNLISRKDIVNLYEHHILHSLAIAKVVSFEMGKKVVDVGSGGGLPGIPLAILFPQTKFLLVDSIRKKINTVEKIVADLNLHNVECLCERAEKLDKKFDYIVGRGVCGFDEFVKITKNLMLKNSQIFYLNGANDTTHVSHKIFNVNDFFEEEFFVGKVVREKKV